MADAGRKYGVLIWVIKTNTNTTLMLASVKRMWSAGKGGKTLSRPGILKQRETCAKPCQEEERCQKKTPEMHVFRTHDSNQGCRSFTVRLFENNRVTAFLEIDSPLHLYLTFSPRYIPSQGFDQCQLCEIIQKNRTFNPDSTGNHFAVPIQYLVLD
jgi:hypothetical protein